MLGKRNADERTIEGFGDEWTRFDQSGLPEEECKEIFESYFSVFPWSVLPKNAQGFDLGCGSGRWAKLVAPRVGRLHCIDPSIALNIARKNLQQFSNCEFYSASVDEMPLEDGSMDFGYSLGVLHHVPDTQAALIACVSKLKSGAPFLVYLYYAFDNRPRWFRAVWHLSDFVRSMVCRLPYRLRYICSQVLALILYLPLARMALILERAGLKVDAFPLSAYRHRGFYTMRTDALDRFGTRLEHRFTKMQVQKVMESAGLDRIKFSEDVPYWCAVGYKR